MLNNLGREGCPPGMGRKGTQKRNKNTPPPPPPPRVTNEIKQHHQHQNNKRTSDDISPAVNQPQQKIANQNATPATKQLHKSKRSTLQEHSSEQQKTHINQNESQNTSITSEDSHCLQIDEGDQNITKNLILDGESVTNSDSHDQEEQEKMQTDSDVED